MRPFFFAYSPQGKKKTQRPTKTTQIDKADKRTTQDEKRMNIGKEEEKRTKRKANKGIN